MIANTALNGAAWTFAFHLLLRGLGQIPTLDNSFCAHAAEQPPRCTLLCKQYSTAGLCSVRRAPARGCRAAKFVHAGRTAALHVRPHLNCIFLPRARTSKGWSRRACLRLRHGVTCAMCVLRWTCGVRLR